MRNDIDRLHKPRGSAAGGGAGRIGGLLFPGQLTYSTDYDVEPQALAARCWAS